MASGNDVRLSKSLSKILRHDAEKLGLQMKPDGYVSVSELLTSPRCWLSRQGFTETDVLTVVEKNDKQRFSVRRDEQGHLEIRANQGHSLEVEALNLARITDPNEFPNVIHGTTWRNWQVIKRQGLKPMTRTHVHLAPGVPGEHGVISGMRRNCDIHIHLNLRKAMEDGLEFYVSSNRVILCRGDSENIIHPRYFVKVVDMKKNSVLDL